MAANRGAIISSPTAKAISTERQLLAEPITPELCSCFLLRAKPFFMNSKAKAAGMELLLMVDLRSMAMEISSAPPRAEGPMAPERCMNFLRYEAGDGRRR